MSTIKVTNLQNASAASPAIVLDANSRATLNGLSYPTEGSLSGRNRVINGSMTVDQRNAGASITPAPGDFVVDRFRYEASQTSKVTCQQNAGAVTPPAGFSHYAGFTSSSAYSVAAADYFAVKHVLEGFNTSSFAWGTASAQAVTLSFWVRSSLTGTFGISIRNGANTRSYPATYTISAANTWEYKTLTIPGDTSGTWPTDNSASMTVLFGLGVGSTYSGTAGAWAGANYLGATGATSVVGTNGATLYLTGVQLEAGSTATPFERRSYGQELLLCQRYYETGTVPLNGLGAQYSPNGSADGVSPGFSCSAIPFAVTKRATPTVPTVTGSSTAWVVAGYTAVSAVSAHTFVAGNITANGVRFCSARIAGNTTPTIASFYTWEASFTWTASAEL